MSAEAKEHRPSRPGPLTGTRVLDLTQVVGGPAATMVLADHGAEVLKIEPPAGDAARTITGINSGAMSPFFETFNRGKASIVRDLKDDADRADVIALAQRADVVVEAFRPGVLDRLGLGYDALSAQNPAVVYASLTGFGSDGPSAMRGGFDLIAQAESGLMSVTGEPDGLPTKVGVHIVDIASGHILAQSIMAALMLRSRTGEGDRIRLSLFDVACTLQGHYLTEQLNTGAAPVRAGNFPASTAPSGVYETTDGLLAIAAYQDPHWKLLIDCLDMPELGGDPELRTLEQRVKQADRLIREVRGRVKQRSTAHWTQKFSDAGIVFGVVREYADVVASDEFAAVELELGLTDPEDPESRFTTLRHPARHSAFEFEATTKAPRLERKPATVDEIWPLRDA